MLRFLQVDSKQQRRKTVYCLTALFSMFRLQVLRFSRHGINFSVRFPEWVREWVLQARAQGSEPAPREQALPAGGRAGSSRLRTGGRYALRSGR